MIIAVAWSGTPMDRISDQFLTPEHVSAVLRGLMDRQPRNGADQANRLRRCVFMTTEAREHQPSSLICI